jgi:TolB protein
MNRTIWLIAAAAAASLLVSAQINLGNITNGEKPTIAIPEFRGSGDAQALMGTFNSTLRGDIAGSGFLKIAPPTMYPSFVPQQPSDFGEAPAMPDTPRSRNRDEMVRTANGGGRWITDWSGPPVNANYLAFGYTAVTQGVLELRGWLYDLSKGSPAAAQVIGKVYAGTADEAGARQVAHQFAADILALWGAQSLFGTHIYFVSSRTGHKEIWAMDPDGRNQHQITNFRSISTEPAVSPDGSKVAFMSYARGTPGIFVFSVDPVRDLRFYNQRASVNETPSFTPDGKQIIYASSAPNNSCCRIYLSNLDGTGFHRITSSPSDIDVEPKINPKTGSTVVFSSSRSGQEQVYLMNIDGTGIERLTPGEGEASNPSWNPDGQIIAFSWTRGFAAGNWNVFVMDVASRSPIQLTHSEGRNENPVWAPDGNHLVFSSTRSGREQIWTMLANGTQLQQLTTQGQNESPVWGK